jgi:hypothetical protein
MAPMAGRRRQQDDIPQESSLHGIQSQRVAAERSVEGRDGLTCCSRAPCAARVFLPGRERGCAEQRNWDGGRLVWQRPSGRLTRRSPPSAGRHANTRCSARTQTIFSPNITRYEVPDKPPGPSRTWPREGRGSPSSRLTDKADVGALGERGRSGVCVHLTNSLGGRDYDRRLPSLRTWSTSVRPATSSTSNTRSPTLSSIN